MALPATTVWEVRTDGNDANCGGFVTGASGTDRSQQAAAQIAYTALVIGGTTTELTSAAFPFSAAEVGNILNVTGGTGFTTGWYQVVSVAAGVATMDRSVGTGGSTGGTGNLGGAFLTIAQGLTLSTVAGMMVYVRGGTYNITTALSPASLGGAYRTRLVGYATTRGDLDRTLSTVAGMMVYVRGGTYNITTALSPASLGGAYRTRLVGYATTRGDLGQPIISVTAAIDGLTPGLGWTFENLELDGTSVGLRGVNPTTVHGTLVNCHIHHFVQYGLSASYEYWSLIRCEVDHNNNGIWSNAVGGVMDCWVHDNTSDGVAVFTTGRVTGNVIANNGGHGLIYNYGGLILNNILYGNGGDGIRATQSYSFNIGAGVCENNILVNNGGYGINQPTAQTHADYPWIDYNAFYNNTSGARQNVNASPHDVTLTGDPFTNAAGNDFSLNNTAGEVGDSTGVAFPV